MSTLKVSKILNANTTDGGIEIDSTGHVQVDGVQMPTAGPLSNRNLVINGSMQVAQRGTTVSSVTSSAYLTCDRFQIGIFNLGTWTITQSSDSPDGFSKSLKLACTAADASPAASDLLFIKYRFEAQDLQHLKYGTSSAETMTLSFWVKSNKTGDASIDLRQRDNSNKLYTLEYNISAANTWEQKVLTITGDTAGVINDDNGIGLEIDWWLNSGSDSTGGAGPSNSWFASDETRRNFDNFGLGGSTDDVFYITGVQLEVGEKATPFEHRSYGDELARCQRYYVEDGGSNFHQLFGAQGFNINTTTCNLKTYLPVPMRTSATLSFTGTPRLDNGAAGFNCTNLTGAHPHPNLNYYSMTATSSGLTQHQPVSIDAGSTAAVVKIDAEL